MAEDSLCTELALALRGRVETALGVSQRLDATRGTPSAVELVVRGPPQGGPATWGGCFAAALRSSVEQAHSAAFVAFERMGGYWVLLELLSDARVPEPSRRQSFYAQFDDMALHATLVGALTAPGPAEAVVRRCLRNLARSPALRPNLKPSIPVLVSNLADSVLVKDSAAALCNIACHMDTKEETVECGAILQLILQLQRPELSAEAAEDLVACLGVLTGGCKKGIEAVFEVAVTKGRRETFAVLLDRLQGDSASAAPLKCLVLDVVGGLCAASPQFKAWIISESPLVQQYLPLLFQSDVAQLRMAGLQFASMLVEDAEFIEAFQRGNGVNALQSVLERDAAQSGEAMQLMAPEDTRRREPTQRDLAQYLISKILMI